jgi:hypothetical protein
MALDGEALLKGFSEFIFDWWEKTTTSAGAADGSSLIDTQLGRKGDNALIDNYFRITSGDADNEISRGIVPFTSATGSMSIRPPFTSQIASSVTYQMHKHDPDAKWRSLDAARLSVLPWVFQEVHDETITADGRSDEFVIPSAIEWGPELAIIETPTAYDIDWNLLGADDSRGNAVSNWVAADGVVASEFDRVQHDKLVPKHESTCVKLVYTDSGADGTYTLSTFDDGVTAATMAGRQTEFAYWVYSRTAGPVTEIITNAGTLATSSAHLGLGWQFMTVNGEVAPDNSTAFEVRLRFPNAGAAAHRTVYVEHAFVALGQVTSQFLDEHVVEVERDDTLKRFWLRGVPRQGRNIRLIGKAPLTALGDTAPQSGSMEVDEKSAKILYAAAARELFGGELLNQPAQRDVLTRISVIEDKRKAYQSTWKYKTHAAGIVSPYRF